MRRLLPAAVSLALLAGAAGCSLTGGPDAGAAANRVAAQLQSGKFTASVFNDPDKVRQQYAAVVAGLGTIRPQVSVADTKTSGSSATTHLDWSWPVAKTPWRYSTTVQLHKSGDAWLADWSPASVAPGLVAGARLTQVRVPAQRGDILGAHDVALVTSRPVVRFGIDKTRLKGSPPGTSARRLATLVGISPGPFAKQVTKSGPQGYVAAITFRKGQVPPAVQAGYGRIPGAVATPTSLPLAPTKQFAAPLLGSVGPATAAIVKQSKGRVQPGDQVGLSGLQLRYDEQLAGTPGVRIDKVDAKGNATQLFQSAPVPGKPLRLTLDKRLQSLAESILANVGPASALVAIRPSTGAVLAAASGPGANGYDIATYGRYAPGSTFKIVNSLALLRSGLTPHSPIPCTTGLDVDGRQFSNDSEFPPGGIGRIPLTTALAYSCNTAFISQRNRLHGDDRAQAAAALGFGVDHNVGYPAFFGQTPNPTGQTTKAADMIGQGQILASPLAMATVVASVVAGHAVLPQLVSGLHLKAPVPSHPLSAKEDSELRSMMRAVVTTPDGTGHGLFGLPGPPVIAKTGTAEFGTTPPLPTHAWMVAGQGDLAVAVFVDRGHTGAGVAGPLLEAFLRNK